VKRVHRIRGVRRADFTIDDGEPNRRLQRCDDQHCHRLIELIDFGGSQRRQTASEACHLEGAKHRFEVDQIQRRLGVGCLKRRDALIINTRSKLFFCRCVRLTLVSRRNLYARSKKVAMTGAPDSTEAPAPTMKTVRLT
jgi:hypothetical protein